ATVPPARRGGVSVSRRRVCAAHRDGMSGRSVGAPALVRRDGCRDDRRGDGRPCLVRNSLDSMRGESMKLTCSFVVIAVLIGTPAMRLVAQSGAATPQWEVLVRSPLPEGIEPVLSVNGLTMPAEPVAEHSHAGPVIGYIVDGEIENQVEPDPPAIYKPGGFFSEAPRHLHKIMRNLSAEPAKLLIFHAGRTGVPESLLKVLAGEPTKLSFATPTQWQVTLPSTVNQEARLIRLTLPADTRTEVVAHSGPGLVYVLDGTITVLGASAQPQTHGAGEVFLDPANKGGIIYRNAG